jgi:hypothetical protein
VGSKEFIPDLKGLIQGLIVVPLCDQIGQSVLHNMRPNAGNLRSLDIAYDPQITARADQSRGGQGND